MDFLNSIFYKSLAALYKLNTNKDGRAKSVLIDAIFEGILLGKDGLDKARLEMALDTATEDWLDFWGNTFGVPRLHQVVSKNLYLTADHFQDLTVNGEIDPNITYNVVTEEALKKKGITGVQYYEKKYSIEEDDPYRKRIIEEIISPKNTIPSIQQATSRYLKNNQGIDLSPGLVDVFEPWTQLLKFDARGLIDGEGRLMSYDYWNYSVVDISLPDSSLITKDLITYLKRIKAGGVIITFTVAPAWELAVDIYAEEKRNNVWNRIDRETFTYASRRVEAFKILQEGDLSLMEDADKGGQLDTYGVLEGDQMIYWEGIDLERYYYTSGLIRNPFNSAVLSLEDYLRIAEVETMTIEEASALELEAIKRNKQNLIDLNTQEGLITMTQNQLIIEHESII